MYNDDETGENVKRNDFHKRTNVKLKLCGSHITLNEYHENTVPYDYQREKLKLTDEGTVELKELGRQSDASEEQKAINARRVQQRRNARIRDLMNCNEEELTVFETLTTTYQDIDTFNQARKEYHRKTERFIQTGKLYGKPAFFVLQLLTHRGHSRPRNKTMLLLPCLNVSFNFLPIFHPPEGGLAGN